MIARLEHVAPPVRATVDPTSLEAERVFHYSIPVLDETGDGAYEDPRDIGSSKTLLRGGELLIAKLNPRKPRIVRARAFDVPVLCSGEFVVLTPRDVEPRYLEYVLRSETTRQYLDSRVQSVTRSQQRVRPEDITKMPLQLPDRPVQRRIAAFLDAEAARIDALLEKKREMIELLDLRAKTLIGHATTKGLDPTLPTRDSGIEWIGRVPRDWEVVKIRHLSTVRRGASPRPIDDPIYFDDEGEYAWVRISDVTAAGRYLSETDQRLSELGSSKSVRLQPGEMFVSIAATVGKPVITKIRCCIHDGFVYFMDLRLNRDFLYYILASALPYGGLGKLGTQLNLNTDTIGDIHVPVPDASEQHRIVNYLDAQLARYERLTRTIRHQIDLLLEHRQTLITCAVTGQLDVAKAAA